LGVFSSIADASAGVIRICVRVSIFSTLRIS
jgi:hypothetical protein